MNEQTRGGYERPSIERLGTLAELTLISCNHFISGSHCKPGPPTGSTSKYIASSPDFHYPAGAPDFNFS